MKKIISLFQRDYETDHRLVKNAIVPGAEWVANGEGDATIKYDGTCCLIKDSILFRRREVKKGKTSPVGFIPACEVDPNTGKQQGWVPVTAEPADKWHREALARCCYSGQPLVNDSTYELCGPKVQGNLDGFTTHVLLLHGAGALADVPRDFIGIRDYLQGQDIEGIVWHHSDGRMVKIKGKDFGFKRTAPLLEEVNS